MHTPERVGRYLVQSIVGVGGFGVVVRAHDEGLDAPVAIKILGQDWIRDADIRQRFLEESRLLRRVRSDHLITVHDVGELDDGRPYFVMEFATRGNLSERLATRGQRGADPASLAALADALADGLGALHRAGVVHRDINPKNLFLQPTTTSRERAETAGVTSVARGLIDPDETVLIGDLGLAKDLVRTGEAASLIGGTAHYQAPEQLDPRGSLRPETDVFAATGVLWEAITGAPPPHPGEVPRALAQVDARWHAVFERGLAADADSRFESMLAWRDAVTACLDRGPRTARMPSVDAPAPAATGPYKGLASFQPEDATRFFGRDRLVAELLDRLGQTRTLMVGGPSGSGKSSLVRAGLIPALNAGGLPGSERWPIALFTPREDPSNELRYQLARARRAATQHSGTDATPGDAHACRIVADSITDLTGGLVLVIDQFEELFTQQTGREAQQEFLALLAALVDPIDSQVRLVMAMRADFYGTSALFPWLAERITDNQVLVGPMSAGELRRAIEEPAEIAGLRLEDGLADTILEDGGDEAGALPLLSHALVETWRRRRGNTLTIAGYREAGGVAGAIAKTAEEVLERRLDAGQRQIARRLLLRMVSAGEGTGDTRRPLAIEELRQDPDAEVLEAVADELIAARLLTAGRDTIELAHEALIQSWPRLRTWIEESRDDLRMRQRIDRAGEEWQEHDQDVDLLYRGTPLQSALEWAEDHRDTLSRAGRELLDASEAARDEEERRRTAAARRSRRIRRAAVSLLGVLTLVAVAASVVALAARDQATARLAQALATQALDLVDEDPRLALALGVEAIARHDGSSPEARAALVNGRRSLAAVAIAPARSPVPVGDALTVVVRPDGAAAVTAGRDGTLTVWDTATGERIGEPFGGDGSGVEELAFTTDGRWLVSGHPDGSVRRWDLEDPTAVPPAARIGMTDGPVWGVAVSPDGATVASASEDGTIRLWDLQQGGAVGDPLVDVSRDFLSVAFAPDGSGLLAGNGRGELWGVRLPGGEAWFEPFHPHTSDVWEIVFHPSGDAFATASSDGRVRVWDTESRELLSEPFAGVASDVRGVQFGRGGEDLFAGDEDGRVGVWSFEERSVGASTASGHGAQILDASLSADGSTLVTLGLDQQLRVWTRGEGSIGLAVPDHEGGAFGVAMDPSGRMIATGDGAGSVRIVDAATGAAMLDPLRLHDDRVWAVAFDDEGALLASGGGDGTVTIVDVASGGVLGRGSGHQGPVTSVAFDGDQVISGSDDGTIRRWGRDGAPVGEPLGPHPGGVTDLVVGPGGLLAVADRQGQLRLWDLGSGQLARDAIAVDDNTLWGVDWSPDGRLVATASADEVVSLWDAEDWTKVAELTPHPGGATDVAFLADGVSLATASRDGSVRLWDLRLARPLGDPLELHAGAIWRLDASRSSPAFVTSSEDGTVQLWDVLDEASACRRVGNAFDAQQRRRYLGEGEPAAGCRDDRS